jgi:LAO/AO transport system kinase
MRTCADYAGALRLLRRRPQDPDGFPKAMTVSALEEAGLEKAWAEMRDLTDWRRAHGHWEKRRAAQARHWFEDEVRQGLLAALTASPETREAMRSTGDAVARGDMTPDTAAAKVLRSLAAKH